MILIEPENIKDWLPPENTPQFRMSEYKFSIWSYDKRAFIRFLGSDECNRSGISISIDFLKIMGENRIYRQGFELRNYTNKINSYFNINEKQTFELIPKHDYNDYYANLSKEFEFIFFNCYNKIKFIKYIPTKKANIQRETFKNALQPNNVKLYDFEHHKLAIWIYEKRVFTRFLFKGTEETINASFENFIILNENRETLKNDILLRNDKNETETEFEVSKSTTFEIKSDILFFQNSLILIYEFDNPENSLIIYHNP